MCIAVVALSLAIYLYILLLLSLSIVKLRLSAPNVFYDYEENDDDALCWSVCTNL